MNILKWLVLSKVVDLTLGFKVLNGENWKAKSLFLDKFVAIFSKKYGKNFVEKKKFFFPLSSRGGGEGISGRATKNRFFLAATLSPPLYPSFSREA